MECRRFSEDPSPGETHHDLASNILHALSKGFLMASAGILLGAVLATHHLAAFGLWTLGGTAAIRAGCVVGSALVRSAGCARRGPETEQARRAREVAAIVRTLPVMLYGEAVRLTD
jgi:hypothetical protein